MKKMLLPACLLIMLLPLAVFSKGENFSPHFATSPAAKQYVKEHVMPVLQQKRQLLERELTTAEKAEVTSCREALKTLHNEHKQDARPAPTANGERPAITDEQRAKFAEIHKQVNSIMERLQAIADKHQVTLLNIHTDLKASREQWRADLTKISATNSNGQIADMHKGGAGLFSFLSTHHYSAAHFLLLPAQGNVNGTLEDLETEMPSEAVADNATTTFQVLPNPASDELVTNNAQLSGQNEFIITDMQGKTVLSLQNIQPAQHINITQIPVGNYIAQLRNNGETVNQKIVISR